MTNASETDPSLSSATAGVTETGGSVRVSPDTTGIGIGAIAHEIGLTKDTLRVWERRYGFPQPLRSTGGERLYPQEQVTKLRLVKRLLDAGHRPSKVLPQSITRLQQLAEDSGVGQDAPDVELDWLVELLRVGRYDDFRFELLKRATREGLARFVLDVAAPLSARVGNAWAAGTLQVYHEHLFSEAMQVALRSLMRPLSEALRGRGAHPRVLLTTLPGEAHGLGILMAEALFALADCDLRREHLAQLRESVEHCLHGHGSGKGQRDDLDVVGRNGIDYVLLRRLRSERNAFAIRQREHGLRHQDAEPVCLARQRGEQHPRVSAAPA
jgi:DNA-binding transcriptional MerR regulator